VSRQKIGVVGTVGVPARYGGFETLVEQLARNLTPSQAKLILYCQRSAYPEEAEATPFAGHRRVFVPLRANGAQSMLHDPLAMLHAALAVRVDTLLVLGYSGAWFLPVLRLLRPGMRIVTNIDGMEWRRDKFGGFAKKVLRGLEWCATRFSKAIIADNAALVTLARDLHGIEPVLIAYGGDHTLVEPEGPAPAPGYWLSIARIEPENNCHMILEAAVVSGTRLVFVGNWAASNYGRELKTQYANQEGISMMDPVYDVARLAALRGNAIGYLHGHSVGGTNPSLVEALQHSNRMLAFDCAFNRSTLDQKGEYFHDAQGLAGLLRGEDTGHIANDELAVLRDRYRWRGIAESYLRLCSP
jgi:glycosyltransferase involved in cell wall biosynthesis